MFDILLLIVRLVLFGVFAIAAIGKLLDLEGSEKSVKAFGTPEEFAKTFAIALPFAEIVFAVCFLFVEKSWLGAIGALILLFSFTGGMIWQLSQGNAPDCHCFGQIHSEPVGKKSLIRNIVFAVLALFLVAQGRTNQGASLAETDSEMMQTILIIFVLTALAVIILYLKKMLASQSEIVKRLDVMEIISLDGAAVQRDDAGDPNDSLPIGSPFPDFKLPDAGGRMVSFENLLAKARPMLFLFVSPTCNPCKALLPEIEAWRSELDGRVNFVIVSSGTPEENKEKFGEAGKAILLQKKREVADIVNAKWTPTALFVGRDGNIASHLAAGDSAIRDLVEKIKTENLDRDFVYIANGTGHVKTRIGESVPELRLEDINGTTITREYFKGRETLVVFWSLTCGHCQKMMSELLEWDKSKNAADPNLIVFSDGPRDEHLELGLRSPILLDKDYKTAEGFGMSGTPSAIVVNEKGEIVTETAIGASKIWALIGKRK